MAHSLAVVVVATLAVLVAASSVDASKNKHPSTTLAPAQPSKPSRDERARAIGNSNLKFSSSLYHVLSEQEGNLIFSPFSIHSILTMASLGAQGETLEQLRTGLSLPPTQATKEGYQGLNRILTKELRGKPILNIANKIYVSKGTQIDAKYQKNAKQAFNTEVEGIDITTPDVAAATINTWVEQQTNHKIKDLVHPGMIGSSSMLLVNAVYFKARWNSVFSPDGTFDKDFKTKPNEIVSTKMMFAKTEFSYHKMPELKCQVVELNYVGNDISMVLVLPDEDFGLQELERKIATSGFESLTNPEAFEETLVTVALPKFKLEMPTLLNEALTKMGMSEMFGQRANFSGMTSKGSRKVRIDNVAHKAFIEVNEEGTEAAGASFAGEPLMAPRPQEYFILDHPFIYLIHHKKSRNILFIGRFVVPPPVET